MPEALKTLHMRNNLSNQHQMEMKERKNTLEDYLNVSSYIKTYSRIASKKILMNMLSVDELNWNQTSLRVKQMLALSLKVS